MGRLHAIIMVALASSAAASRAFCWPTLLRANAARPRYFYHFRE